MKIKTKLTVKDNPWNEFRNLIQYLRKNCPWDKDQTHESLIPFALEEASELADAIVSGNLNDIRDELGDVLLQVVLHAAIADENKNFTLDDVIRSIYEKMIERHQELFSTNKIQTVDEQLGAWNLAKEKKKTKGSVLDGIPSRLTVLEKAKKIGERSKKIGFDWKETKQIFSKVDEEIAELKEAIASANKDDIEMELGDVLFTLVQLARSQKVNAETALRKNINKVTGRIKWMEEYGQSKKIKLSDLSPEEILKIWKKAKQSD